MNEIAGKLQQPVITNIKNVSNVVNVGQYGPSEDWNYPQSDSQMAPEEIKEHPFNPAQVRGDLTHQLEAVRLNLPESSIPNDERILVPLETPKRPQRHRLRKTNAQ